MTAVDIHISKIEARIASANEPISTKHLGTECPYLCQGLLQNEVNDDNPCHILSTRERPYSIPSVPAEPHVLHAETTRASPRKERKSKTAPTPHLFVQGLTFACPSLVPWPLERREDMGDDRPLWRQSVRLERAIRREPSLFWNNSVLRSSLTAHRWYKYQ